MAQARMKIAHRIAAMIAFVPAIALTGLGETVTNVRGSQRPNSKLVDIYYDLNAVDGWSYTIEVAIEGRMTEVTAATFSGDVGKGIAPGKNRHILWEAGADWRNKKGDVKAVVTATIEAKKGKPKKVRLWEGGPYWADRNIGADAPWEAGLYFWWGDTTGHRLLSDGTFGFSFEASNCPTYGKGNKTLQSEGWITSDGVLAPSHDAAHVMWGGSWRMPTKQEFDDLVSKCDCIPTIINKGVYRRYGVVVRGRGDFASNSIFLPCAGRAQGNSLDTAYTHGFYWSSVACSDSWYSWYLDFNQSGSLIPYSYIRYDGLPVRPVQ